MSPNLSLLGALVTVCVAAISYQILSTSPITLLRSDNAGLPRVDLGYAIYQASYSNDTGQFYNFSNIRYAAPPTGERRFQPPQLPLSNRSVVEDGTHGEVCPQVVPVWARNLLGWTEYPMVGSEDCLYLDVDVPKSMFDRRTRGKGAPVLVWIYGGGYTAGSKWQFGSGAGLLAIAKEPIIYVALNYRLGMFGFLAGLSYVTQGGTTNFALLDQRFALGWVQRHIAAFGGDATRVTVTGQSAGGGSILHQVTAYGGQRESPFSKAIIQSPGFYTITSNSVMERDYNSVLRAAGCDSAPSGLECLKSLSEHELKQVNLDVIDTAPYGQFVFGPTVDGIFTPALPGNLLAAGAFNHNLTLMVGQNYNEAGDIVERTTISATYFSNLLDNFMPLAQPDVRDHITTLYPPPNPAIFDAILMSGEGYPTYSKQPPYYTTWPSLIDRFISDAVYICLTNYLARSFRNQTYSYHISIPPGTHGVETPYVFYDGGLDSRVLNASLARIKQRYLTNFVVEGDPNEVDLPVMPVYGTGNVVTDINVTSIGMIRDPAAKEECYWWQKGLYI